MKVKLLCKVHDFQSTETEVVDVPDDITDKELLAMAEEFFWNRKEPEWWYEKVEDE